MEFFLVVAIILAMVAMLMWVKSWRPNMCKIGKAGNVDKDVPEKIDAPSLLGMKINCDGLIFEVDSNYEIIVVSGDSEKDEKIFDGDILGVKRWTPDLEPGKIIVFAIPGEESVKVRKFIQYSKKSWLVNATDNDLQQIDSKLKVDDFKCKIEEYIRNHQEEDVIISTKYNAGKKEIEFSIHPVSRLYGVVAFSISGSDEFPRWYKKYVKNIKEYQEKRVHETHVHKSA